METNCKKLCVLVCTDRSYRRHSSYKYPFLMSKLETNLEKLTAATPRLKLEKRSFSAKIIYRILMDDYGELSQNKKWYS